MHRAESGVQKCKEARPKAWETVGEPHLLVIRRYRMMRVIAVGSRQ